MTKQKAEFSIDDRVTGGDFIGEWLIKSIDDGPAGDTGFTLRRAMVVHPDGPQSPPERPMDRRYLWVSFDRLTLAKARA